MLDTVLFCGSKAAIQFGEVALESATYSCPWLKTGTLISNPTYFKDCPWDLLIVIANANRTGNCRLVKWNGNAVEEGVKEIRGIKTCSPACGPKSKRASKTRAKSV